MPPMILKLDLSKNKYLRIIFLSLLFFSYTRRPNVVPLYFFLVDVSKIAVKAGVIETFSKVVREAIINKSIPAIERSKVLISSLFSKL